MSSILTSLVSTPVRAVRVSTGSLEPSEIISGDDCERGWIRTWSSQFFFVSFLVLHFSFFQNNYNETRVGYYWTGQHVSSYLCLFPSRAMTTITITVIQRKPERFMMKHTNPPQMTLSEFFFSSFFYGLSSLTENLVCFRAVLCVGEERCVPT